MRLNSTVNDSPQEELFISPSGIALRLKWSRPAIEKLLRSGYTAPYYCFEIVAEFGKNCQIIITLWIDKIRIHLVPSSDGIIYILWAKKLFLFSSTLKYPLHYHPKQIFACYYSGPFDPPSDKLQKNLSHKIQHAINLSGTY